MNSPKELRFIPLDRIRLNPNQPRRLFAEAELMELAESIKAVGLIHPPVVRQIEDQEQYELVSGERRFRASQIAGLIEIPVIVCSTSQLQSAEAALIENIQRVDLNAIEIAQALKRLMQEFHLNQNELALRIGKKRSTVANYLRLLTLPQSIQDNLIEGNITMGHAKAILSHEKGNRQVELLQAILKDKLNVRQSETLSQRFHGNSKQKVPKNQKNDIYLDQLAQKLQYRLGTKVSLQRKGSGGSISIEYFSLDDLDRVLGILDIKMD